MVKREAVAGVTRGILHTFLTFKLCLSSFPVAHFIWFRCPAIWWLSPDCAFALPFVPCLHLYSWGCGAVT